MKPVDIRTHLSLEYVRNNNQYDPNALQNINPLNAFEFQLRFPYSLGEVRRLLHFETCFLLTLVFPRNIRNALIGVKTFFHNSQRKGETHHVAELQSVETTCYQWRP